MIEEIFYNLDQGVPIGDHEAVRARAVADAAVDELTRLQHQVARLELIVEALTRVVVNSGNVTPDQFLQIVRTIDAEDGVVDGKRDLSRLRKICPKCSRASSGVRQVCMWCNTDISQVAPQSA